MKAKVKVKTRTKAKGGVKQARSSKPVRKPSASAGARLKWNPRVACRTLDGTAFILLNSRMLRLNEVGTYIWEQFEDGSALDAVLGGLVSEFDTTAKRAQADLQSFVKQLVAKEVLVPVTAKLKSGRSS